MNINEARLKVHGTVTEVLVAMAIEDNATDEEVEMLEEEMSELADVILEDLGLDVVSVNDDGSLVVGVNGSSSKIKNSNKVQIESVRLNLYQSFIDVDLSHHLEKLPAINDTNNFHNLEQTSDCSQTRGISISKDAKIWFDLGNGISLQTMPKIIDFINIIDVYNCGGNSNTRYIIL